MCRLHYEFSTLKNTVNVLHKLNWLMENEIASCFYRTKVSIFFQNMCTNCFVAKTNFPECLNLLSYDELPMITFVILTAIITKILKSLLCLCTITVMHLITLIIKPACCTLGAVAKFVPEVCVSVNLVYVK